jgi:hypothetical protein
VFQHTDTVRDANITAALPMCVLLAATTSRDGGTVISDVMRNSTLLRHCHGCLLAMNMLVLCGCCFNTDAARPTPSVTEVGDAPIVATVHAKPHWNDTGLEVRKGVVYRFSAQGVWYDAGHPVGAEGYPSLSFIMRWAEGWRRVPDAPWFALICSVDRDKRHLEPVMIMPDHALAADGQLTCFANDVPFMYWNNSGSIEMTVQRVHSSW